MILTSCQSGLWSVWGTDRPMVALLYWTTERKFTALETLFFLCVKTKSVLFQCEGVDEPWNRYRWKDINAINAHMSFHLMKIRIYWFIQNSSVQNKLLKIQTYFAPSNSKSPDVLKFYKIHQNYQLWTKSVEWILVFENNFF